MLKRNVISNTQYCDSNCQAPVPSPVSIDLIPIPNPKQLKSKVQLGLGLTLKSKECSNRKVLIVKKSQNDLERVQKAAVRIIFGKPYDSYTQTLKDLDMMRLSARRDIICLKFAKNSRKLENFQKLFPVHKNFHGMDTRQHEKYRLIRSFSKRYAVSAVPSMQRLLNKEYKKQKDALKSLLSPTNYACTRSY